MTEPELLYHHIADTMPGATQGKMFGSPCIKAPNGKAAALYYQGAMVFKLNAADGARFLGLYGVQEFSPMGDRPMAGWIQVPFDYADLWPELTNTSMQLVSLPADIE